MEIYELMKTAVLDGDEEESARLAQQALDDNLDLQMVLNEGFLAGIKEAGQLYEDEEYFLPDLICSADAMKCALAILDETIKKGSDDSKPNVKIALVTVNGDVHDIGKTIVGAMLTASGYEVHDLGTDVPNEVVLEKVKALKPQILGLSALLTSTMEEQKNIIDLMDAENLRTSTKVIIGGAPANQEWANQIKADGYSDNAISAAKLISELLN